MNRAATLPQYANGRFYTAPFGRAMDAATARTINDPPPISLTVETGWAAFWKAISDALTRRGYGETSQALYRSVLRNLYRYARRPPGCVDAALIEKYIAHLADKSYTWHWTGMTISVLRTVFDKLCGKSVTRRLITPKRAYPLPEILSRSEVRALLAAATTPRDQLLLGLLYGCGLKPGELVGLTWDHIDPETQILRVGTDPDVRELEIPPDLLPILAYGKLRCPATDFIFQGRYAGTPLSLRMIEIIVRRARKAADILKPVTAMTLRHAYAVHCLEAGNSVRDVQMALGHRDIRTTLRYRRCMLPEGVESPLDILRRRQRASEVPPPRSNTDTAPPAPQCGLFSEPPSVSAVELPFCEPGATGCAGFYRLLKTHLIGRFLGLRRFSRRGS